MKIFLIEEYDHNDHSCLLDRICTTSSHIFWIFVNRQLAKAFLLKKEEANPNMDYALYEITKDEPE
jgi:hypothetical protein